MKDAGKIITAVERIDVLDIAGGEALLHKNLHLLIDFLASEEKIKKIHIVSNGMVVPDDDTLVSLREHRDKVAICISDYSASGVDNANTIAVLQNNNITHHILKDMVWIDRGDASFRNYDSLELSQITENCSTYRKNPYFTLINGILSAHCPTAGSLMHYLELYNDCEGEFINVREQDLLSEESLIALNEHTMLSACNYCVPTYLAGKCKAGEQIIDNNVEWEMRQLETILMTYHYVYLLGATSRTSRALQSMEKSYGGADY